MSQRVSLVDVAKEAGVSVTTVSRVINNIDHPVDSETRKRVLQVVERLGYAPSALARALVTQRSGILGALVGDNADPYFATIVHGIHEAAQEFNAIVMIFNTLRDPNLELKFLTVLDAYRADGIIFAGGALIYNGHPDVLDKKIKSYQAHGGCVIALTDHTLEVPVVTIENFQIAYDATRYLIELGHRKIAYVGGPVHLSTSGQREYGFRRAMQEAGLSEDRLVTGDFTFESGVQSIQALLSNPERPTAVLAATDLTALGCMVGAQEYGLRIPTDISVMGIDDIKAAQYVTPSLTTIRIPMQEMGKKAVQLIFSALNGEAVPNRTILPHEFVIRGTTASLREGRKKAIHIEAESEPH